MRRIILGALAALLLIVAGCGGAPAPPSPAGTVTSSASAEQVVAEETDRVAEPASIEIPKIGAVSTVVSLGLNPDETVQVPPVEQPMQAGWYQHGPRPGEIGPAVVLGHVDGGGKPGIFHRLRELAPGDEVVVTRQDGGVAVFVVRLVERVAKTEFPTEKVYGETDAAELRLITCGGSFDPAAKSYRDNVIVYATLAE
ncbi:class F sortase [Alloactinosynnema sp. L-07]|uniref:class F sortase n=1 Tax=Alloactinosynnema sp. L-07 TaxID=1653480 RepID=UPI0006B4C47D|nr:class F sortase [Alloactinosynnema sp. L-07]